MIAVADTHAAADAAADMGWVELMRLTAQLLHERSMTSATARALAGQLDVWQRGGLDTADVRRTQARIIDLERYGSRVERVEQRDQLEALAAGADVEPPAAAGPLERLAHQPAGTVAECPRCGQQLTYALGGPVCEPCAQLDRAPQGEALGLFDTGAYAAPTPAPVGQGGLF